MTGEMYQKLAQAVIDGHLDEAKALAQDAIEQGHDLYACITKGLVKGIQHVGKLHASGEIPLPELIISSDAMDDYPGDDRKTLVGAMLTDDDPADDSREFPFLHWIT